MRVLVAPNAFKGSLSCVKAADAMARGVSAALPSARVESIPVADGGDGLIDALKAAMGGTLVTAPARAPQGEARRAAYLWIPAKKTAVIEMARASGLALVLPARQRVMAASTRGTGDLMRDAVRRGARTIIVGMGGSASNDGGAGMARALGARLLDQDGRELPDGAEDLRRLVQVDARAVRILLSGVRVIALADVTNPLLGPHGSARVFGPQKGATAAQVRRLEHALAVWARALHRDLGVSVAAVPGAGAAGGLGAGLLAFAKAELAPGADWILKKTGAARALKSADLVVTGEGRLDRTSLYGKAPVALARLARKCVAVAGQVEPRLKTPFHRVVSFAQAGAPSEADAMKHAARWARKAAFMAVSGLTAFAVSATLPAYARGADIAAVRAIDEAYFHRDNDDNLAMSLSLIDQNAHPGDPAVESALEWRRCRSLVRRGETKKSKADQMSDYDLAKTSCEKSIALSSGAADAHFWLGVALGRWAETKGMMKALFTLKTIKKEMAETLKLDPGHGGAHHVLAEILWQVPGIAGGDKKKALAEFEAAVKLSPTHSANYLPLADAYLHFGRTDDARATIKALQEIKEPADPAEFSENLADAKNKLEKLAP